MSAVAVLRLALKPSRLLAGVVVLAHGLALAVAWISLGGWALAAVAGAILASLGASLLQVLRCPLSLELHEDGRASWSNRQGSWHEGQLGRNNFVSAALVVLELEQGGSRRKRVALMADSTSPEDFRRLRVWLRWRRSPARAE